MILHRGGLSGASFNLAKGRVGGFFLSVPSGAHQFDKWQNIIG